MSERERTALEIISEDMEQLRVEVQRWKTKALALRDERDAARTEAARLQEAESDEAWMRRVYPQHAWSPDDGITYAQFCRLSRGKWEAEHTALRERHAAAVEAAFREGYEAFSDAAYVEGGGDFVVTTTADAAWLASEARKGVARD